MAPLLWQCCSNVDSVSETLGNIPGTQNLSSLPYLQSMMPSQRASRGMQLPLRHINSSGLQAPGNRNAVGGNMLVLYVANYELKVVF